jgi:hypothetical protein
LVIVAGCECRKNISSVSGEVRWEWDTAAGVEGDTSARVDFPPTTMGARRDQTIWVRNVGRAPFTMTEFAQLAGSPTTLNTMLVAGSTFEVRWDPTVVLNPTERTQITVSFTPPVSENTSIDYESDLQLRPSGANASPLTLTGKAIAGQCDAPEIIDFGSVPLRSTLTSDISVRNDGAAPALVTAGGVTGAPVGVFEVNGLGMGGKLEVQPGESPNLTVKFTPSEPGDFMGEFMMRRSDSCPQRRVQLKGRGVQSCITWKAEPPDDAAGQGAHFGAVAPNTVKAGKVTWSNACSLAAELSEIHTTEATFAITSNATIALPASMRDGTGTWVDGTAVTTMEFRPVVLGPKAGVLQVTTNFISQPGLAVSLKGFGGGPRIQITPSPVFAVGRIGFTPGAMPGTFVNRTIRVSNVGTRPNPSDGRVNLHLGVDGQGPTYFEVNAINGTTAEICVGDWDVNNGACTNTVGIPAYDAAFGIEAGTAGLNLPIRIMPASAGPKEWELVVYSDDVSNPEVRVRITAEAMAAPPCNYSVAPTTLNYGLMNVPQMSDLSFTLTNLGTTATEVCYFNGITLSPTTDAAFSIVNNPIDLTLNAGQSTAITVRAQPTVMPQMSTRITGEVLFNVSTPGAPQAVVLLDATVAPSCLTITPSPLTFPDAELECGAPSRSVVVTNTCPNAVNINGSSLTNPALAPVGTGTCTTPGGCAQFAITSGLTNGTLNPSQSRTMLLGFRPYLLGMQQGELTINVQQGSNTVPYVVPISGMGRARTSANCGVQVTCPGPMTVSANSTVTLSPTFMVSGGSPMCSWGITSRPNTSNGTFSAPNSCGATNYFADVVGTHIVNFSVNDGLGSSAQCQTPITVTANGDLWIELTWNRPNDMDLHLIHPNAGAPGNVSSWFNPIWDCDYITDNPSWSANPQNNPSLDRDDITGQGPENTRINTPVLGINYTVGVHMYSYAASPNPVTSTVKVYCGGQLVTTQVRTMSTNKDMWVVGTINFMTSSGAPCTFTPINTQMNVP